MTVRRHNKQKSERNDRYINVAPPIIAPRRGGKPPTAEGGNMENESQEKSKAGIYTLLRGQREPEFVAATWHEVIAFGWQFIGTTNDQKHILMTRNGYINEFWQVTA